MNDDGRIHPTPFCSDKKESIRGAHWVRGAHTGLADLRGARSRGRRARAATPATSTAPSWPGAPIWCSSRSRGWLGPSTTTTNTPQPRSQRSQVLGCPEHLSHLSEPPPAPPASRPWTRIIAAHPRLIFFSHSPPSPQIEKFACAKWKSHRRRQMCPLYTAPFLLASIKFVWYRDTRRTSLDSLCAVGAKNANLFLVQTPTRLVFK